MRVMIDARSVKYAQTGISRHVLDLILGLSHIDSPLEFVVLHSHPKIRKIIEKVGGIHRNRFHWVESGVTTASQIARGIGRGTKNFVENSEIPFLVKLHRIDLFHDIGLTGAWTVNVPSIATVHELAALRVATSEAEKTVISENLRRKLRKSRLIITTSKTNAEDIINQLYFSMPKIRVIPGAIDPWYFDRASVEEIKAMRIRFGLKGKYFFCVTNTERPGKNADFALKMAKEWTGEEEWVFTLPPQPGFSTDKKSKVKFIDKVSDNWLRPLYADSLAVVVPSTYEGFSMPPMEGLAAGAVPVVSSIAAHREVLRDIIPENLYFDPADEASFRRALEAVTSGAEPLKEAVRSNFKALRDQYSYIETAKKVHSVYCESI